MKSDEPPFGIVTPLLNRKPDGAFEFPADNLYLIAPKGYHPHSESGMIQVIDEVAVEAMANAFKPGEELLVDFDHESWSKDKRTVAAGWIQNLEGRSGGLYAEIRWSRCGKEALGGGDYRFLSPVWTLNNCRQIDETHIRPMALTDAGITNRPNLRGMAALSNRDARRERVAAAVDSFYTEVCLIHAGRNEAWESAWESAKTSHGEVYRNALRDAGYGIIQNAAEPLRPTQTWPGGHNPYLTFDGIVKQRAASAGISYERAYEKAKLSHPNEYTQMLSEYERDEAIRAERIKL